MSTTIAVASPSVVSAVTGARDKFLAAISNGNPIVVTVFSTAGLLMTILFAIYLGPLSDPAALLIQTSKAPQINVAQNSLVWLVSTSAGEGDTDRTKMASVKKPLQPAPDADGVALADYQPPMATGLDLNGPPKRFSAKELLRTVEIPGF